MLAELRTAQILLTLCLKGAQRAEEVPNTKVMLLDMAKMFFVTPPREQVPYCEALAGKCLSQTCRETLEDMLSSKLCTQPRKSLELQRHWMYLQGHWIKRESVSHCTSMQQLLESYGTAAAEEGVHCTSQTLVFIRVGRNCHETTPEYYLCGWLWW